jgi:hypothetical protein
VPLVDAGPSGEDQGKDGKCPILPPDIHAGSARWMDCGMLADLQRIRRRPCHLEDGGRGGRGQARREGASWSTRAKVKSSWR